MISLMVLVYAITLSRGAYILVEVDSAHVSAPLRKTSVKHRPSMKKSFRFSEKKYLLGWGSNPRNETKSESWSVRVLMSVLPELSKTYQALVQTQMK